MPSDLSSQALHSRYNPEQEAERYINSLELNNEINNTVKCFILIEPGEGYMIPVLQKKFPNAKIIALYVNNAEPEKILEKELPNILSSYIKIIEWRPSMNFYKDAYVSLLSKTVKYIKKIDAEKRTVSAFGVRWVRNFFKNIGNINHVLLYKETNIPVIITGSGPSLETALLDIKKVQDNCLVIAASSSVMALVNSGIKPDLVIATDGGAWALKHLYPFYRYNETANSALAVNLCAALPSQCQNTPQLILNDGSLWQSIILHELKLPSVLIPQRGTVTASAIELALQLTKGNIYLAGLDLGIKDIRTHVKPYSFDNLLYERAGRFTPIYSESFIRSRLLKDGGSMDIYADWFKNQFNIWPKRIFNIENYNEQSADKSKDLFKSIPVNNKEFNVDILYEKDVRTELELLLGEDVSLFLSHTGTRAKAQRKKV